MWRKILNERTQDKLVLLIKRYISTNFSEGNWDEIAYLTGCKNIIYNHSRLLRSLHFGDEDYDACIFDVLENILKKDPANLQIIIDYIKLPEWMKNNFPDEHEELYGHSQTVIKTAEKVAIDNSFDLYQHIARIRDSVESDPELAIGSIKELLEAVLKSIIDGFDDTPKSDKFPALLKQVQKMLKLDPSDIKQDARGLDIIKRTLSSIGQIVIGLNELRNIYGTGHGQVSGSGVSPRHARLAVTTGASLAVFLMETYEIQKQTK